MRILGPQVRLGVRELRGYAEPLRWRYISVECASTGAGSQRSGYAVFQLILTERELNFPTRFVTVHRKLSVPLREPL